MSEFTINYLENIYSAHIEANLAFDPADFLHYDNEDDVVDAITEQCQDELNTGYVVIGGSDIDIAVPEDFWLVWKQLKEDE